MTDVWTFKSKRYDGSWRERLWLYGEINVSSCIDDIDYPATGEEQVDYWRRYVRSSSPDWWEADAVSVSWYIEGDNVFEGSPDCPTDTAYWAQNPVSTMEREHFATFFTRPINDRTGVPLRSWDDLPRRYRFPEFSRVYGFVPPHQAFVPVRTWTPWTHEPVTNLGPSSSCLRCGRSLSDAMSVEAGHGPWCARKTLIEA